MILEILTILGFCVYELDLKHSQHGLWNLRINMKYGTKYVLFFLSLSKRLSGHSLVSSTRILKIT